MGTIHEQFNQKLLEKGPCQNFFTQKPSTFQIQNGKNSVFQKFLKQKKREVRTKIKPGQFFVLCQVVTKSK